MSESAFIPLIEIFDGSGYDEGRKLVKDMLQKRLHKGGIWMKTINTFYSYGLNERERKSDSFTTIGSQYLCNQKV